MADDPRKPDESPEMEERWALLQWMVDLLERPMIALAFVWLWLILVDTVTGLSPALLLLSNIIWVIFILDFLLEFTVAPSKTVYLRQNWTTAIAIVIPAFRLLRAFRAFRVLRGLRVIRSVYFVRLLASVRRGSRALGNTLRRRGFGYVVLLTIIVIFSGAAGMTFFESPQALQEAGFEDASGLPTYGDALWWTAMMITTMGSGYWPYTVAGRILCWLLALYAFVVFGYITATIASHFISTDRGQD